MKALFFIILLFASLVNAGEEEVEKFPLTCKVNKAYCNESMALLPTEEREEVARIASEAEWHNRNGGKMILIIFAIVMFMISVA